MLGHEVIYVQWELYMKLQTLAVLGVFEVGTEGSYQPGKESIEIKAILG